MNAAYRIENGRAQIYLCSRDAKRNRAVHKIEGYTPHFWVKDDNGPLRSIFDQPIREVRTKLPTDVRAERKKYEEHFEADILFPWRYLYDRGIRCGYRVQDGFISPAESLDVPPKKGYFDLEVLTPPEIMARPANPKFPICSFQFSNNYTDEITLFMLKTNLPVTEEIPIPEGFSCTKALTLPVTFHRKFYDREWDVTIKPNIYLYDDEKLMIHDATLWSSWQDWDAAGGYNSDFFDWPYWIRRANFLRVNIRVLSPFRRVECRRRKELIVDSSGVTRWTGKWKMQPYVKGISLIDFFKMYRKWAGGRQGSKRVIPGKPFASTFDFHLVMERECGFYYVDLGDRVRESILSNPLGWVEYCTGDAYALRILDKEKGIVRYFDRLRRIVGLPLESAIHNARLIDTRLLRLRKRPLPSRKHGKKHRVKGAIVLLPDIGIHENVAYIDEATLYPMLIRVYNLSPETYVSDPKDWRPDDIIVGPTEDGEVLHFRSHPEGIFPRAVRYDMEEREKYRKKLKGITPEHPDYELTKMLETLHKFLACSYYGVTGYEHFRLYSDPVRKAICFLGRESLRECAKDCEAAGYRVRYGDTDSIFVQLTTSVPGEGRIIEGIVSKTLKRIAWKRGATFFIEAKYEQYCKRIIFVPKLERKHGRIIAAKKRYAYTDENDNLYVVGLAPRRSSTPRLTSKLMLEWLVKVLVHNDVKGAIELIRDAWHYFNTYPVNQIALPRGLHRTIYKVRNPWLDGCKYMTERYGKIFREDKKPLLVWMKGRRKKSRGKRLLRQLQKSKGKQTTLSKEQRGCDTDVVCITETDETLPEELLPYVDWEKMRIRVLRNHFEPLFQAIGVSFSEVTAKKKVKQGLIEQWT